MNKKWTPFFLSLDWLPLLLLVFMSQFFFLSFSLSLFLSPIQFLKAVNALFIPFILMSCMHLCLFALQVHISNFLSSLPTVSFPQLQVSNLRPVWEIFYSRDANNKTVWVSLFKHSLPSLVYLQLLFLLSLSPFFISLSLSLSLSYSSSRLNSLSFVLLKFWMKWAKKKEANTGAKLIARPRRLAELTGLQLLLFNSPSHSLKVVWVMRVPNFFFPFSFLTLLFLVGCS